jgi:predicted adenylyl cyclase CyaB
MEIEIRAQIGNPKKITNLLKKDKDVVFVSEKAEKDIYFKHSTDTDRKLVLRIRRTKSGDMLTFKAKSKGDDTAWPDVDLPLNDAKSLEKILRGSDYEEVVTITKKRSTYKTKKEKFEINIDHIQELGWFIEIEGRGTQKERKHIEEKLNKTLTSLGINQADIVRQGYVPLALAKKLAK